ncbi:MAG TPA: FAD-dependent oxidoreductase [Pyrinomonadaceae bacterium]|nr:FAD-dependent oxidoreductase [Pyrinomonadaceae bacterium]
MGLEWSEFDVLIIGAGPAGLSAAIWCRDLGLRSALIEKAAELGGQLHAIHNPINNYLGIRAKNGSDLLDKFLLSSKEFLPYVNLSSEVMKLDVDTSSLTLADGRKLIARAIVLATGVRRRRLNIPGEVESEGRGKLISGVGERESVRGSRIAIVGGGDAAIENALLLADLAEKVVVIHRRDRLSARPDFVERVLQDSRIEILFETEVAAINSREVVESIDLCDGRTGEMRRLEVDKILIRIGVVPNSEIVKGIVNLDPDGYVEADASGQTSHKLIYAVGDVAMPRAPTIATACGMGAAAAKSIALRLSKVPK